MTDKIVLDDPKEFMEILDQVKKEAVAKVKDHLA